MSSKIQWLWPPGRKGEVFNPVSGCTKISPGCANCYAESFLKRFPNSPSYSPSFLPGEALVKLHPDRLDRPLHWRDPRCVFVNSVSDLFHEEVPFWFVDKVFAIMALTPQHQYIILTKRPERMAKYCNEGASIIQSRSEDIASIAEGMRWVIWDARGNDVKNYRYVSGISSEKVANRKPFPGWPIPNVWLGTSIENQYWMKQRGDIMNEIDWPNKLASFEPLLGPIDPTGYEKVFQWFVIGGESGPGARPMHPLWSSRLWHHLIPHAPGFWKQWGQWRPFTISEGFKPATSNTRRVRYNPKGSKDSDDDRWMARARSTQVYGGEWTEDRDIHRWPKSMKVEEVKNATR